SRGQDQCFWRALAVVSAVPAARNFVIAITQSFFSPARCPRDLNPPQRFLDETTIRQRGEETMAIRDRLIARCQKLLPAGTQIRHVFRCNSPVYGIGPTSIIRLLDAAMADYFIVAVTADEIFVLRASSWLPTYPKALETRLPRNHLFNLERDG